MHKAQVGTIIQGTLCQQDLLKAFTQELERLTENTNMYFMLLEEARGALRDIGNGPVSDTDITYVGELIEDLCSHLNEFAPEGHYFGSHEGDGADFGFWPTYPDAAHEYMKGE